MSLVTQALRTEGCWKLSYINCSKVVERSNWLWFYFQYEVKAPVPSACFRNICKQMAKMHEAIYDLLPEEQTQVNVILEIHVTPPLQMRMNSVTRETSASAGGGGGNSFLSLCGTHTLKGLAAVTQTARTELKCWDVAGRAMRHTKKTDFQPFELHFNV